jgi:hypothetical protein
MFEEAGQNLIEIWLRYDQPSGKLGSLSAAKVLVRKQNG